MLSGRELHRSEIVKPGSPEHTEMITSSKVAPMLRDDDLNFLGIGYDSAYDTYQYLTGEAKKDVSGMDEIFRYGHAAEKFARYWLQDTMPGWTLSTGEVAYGEHPMLDMPHQATLDMRATKGKHRKVVEVKAPKVDRGVEDKWIPQLQMNMAVSGIHEALLVLVPRYGEVSVHEIKFDEPLWDTMVEDINDFWRRIIEGDPPPHEGSALWRDEQAKLYKPDAKVVPVVLNEGYTQRYADAVAALDAAERELAVVENEIIEQMGAAPYVKGADGRKIVSRRAGSFAKSRVPKKYLEDKELLTPQFDRSKLRAKYPDLYDAALGAPSYTFEKKGWKDNE